MSKPPFELTDTCLIILGSGWLLLWGIVFVVSYLKDKTLFDTTSMRLVLVIVAWIGASPILAGITCPEKLLVAVIDLVVFTGLVIALWLVRD